MSLVREIRRRFGDVIGPTLGALLVGYFMYHSVQGDRGIMAWIHLKLQVAQAEATYIGLHGARTEFEKRVDRLRTDQLDPDLLDERARIMAGLVRPDELIIYFPRDRR
jgi:cell division protein FtsB